MPESFSTAQSFTARSQGCKDRAEQRPLNQHQTMRPGMMLLGGGHQGWFIATVELVGADQQLHATDP